MTAPRDLAAEGRAEPKPKAKGKTIRAYAVVCANGRWYEPSATANREMAREEARLLNAKPIVGPDCGGNPHVVVPLSGVMPEKGK